MRSAVPALCLLCLALGGARQPAARAASQGADPNAPQVMGQMAPAWSVQGWVNSEPLDVKQLRGKVVLLRFLNDSALSAASLNELIRVYGGRGLAVVGIFFPTPMPEQISLEHVRDFAAAQKFDFPIALDSRWETLNRYWPQGAASAQTASTFLIDRKGIIRYIQPDGLFEKNSRLRVLRAEYANLERAIESLLKPEEGPAAKTAEEPKATRFFGN